MTGDGPQSEHPQSADLEPAPRRSGSLLGTQLRVLTFRAPREELVGLGRKHLVWGLAITWLVGVGRYWDDPRATALQHLGVGSVVYVFVLAALLWLIAKPLRPRDWSYAGVLTFVTLTSLPALLYALPVERWVSLGAARSLNVAFLAVVALWRVALLVLYLRRAGGLSRWATTVATLLPLSAIVTALALLNLQHVVFNLMGGLRDENPHRDAYGVVIQLTMISWLLFVPLLVMWGVLALRARKRGGPA